jgi:hypothetical protein
LAVRFFLLVPVGFNPFVVPGGIVSKMDDRSAQPALGRPRGSVASVCELVDRNGKIRVLIGLPQLLSDALAARPELCVAAHLRVAVTQALQAEPRPDLLEDIEYGPRLQVRLPRELLEQVEAAYGVACREAAIITAAAAYLGKR